MILKRPATRIKGLVVILKRRGGGSVTATRNTNGLRDSRLVLWVNGPCFCGAGEIPRREGVTRSGASLVPLLALAAAADAQGETG
jgi:hypothetical protein